MRYIDKILINVINDAISIGIPISDNIVKTVYIDTKIYNRVAACYKYALINMYIIHISEDTLKASKDEIKNIIAHEILHTCQLGMDHGDVWQKYCKLMNDKLGYNIKRRYAWDDLLK